LAAALQNFRKVNDLTVPILVKIAPDLDDAARRDIADIALARRLDGLIVGNTTIARPDTITDAARDEAGGLSGRPLFAPSTALLADMYRRTAGKVVLVGVGGVSSADDAYAKIRAGASLVQLYTALAYHGLGLIDRIKSGLAIRLAADGFASVADAVGIDAAKS
jgi:dihydroorotate dehydrogenase